jgi:hypothetical protein
MSFSPNQTNQSVVDIGKRFSNSSFTEKKEKDEHLGFLGPVIRAEVGETIVVNFKNMVS